MNRVKSHTKSDISLNSQETNSRCLLLGSSIKIEKPFKDERRKHRKNVSVSSTNGLNIQTPVMSCTCTDT